jgi:LPXTG-motif cell wall-anchored protein
MNFKKIIAAVAASALALSVMAFNVSAADEASVNVNAKDTVTWADTVVPVQLTGNGSYSATIEVAEPATGWGYLTINATEKAPEAYVGSTLTFDSLILNGEVEVPFANKSLAFVDDTGAFNVNAFNCWWTDGNNIDMNATTKEGDAYAFVDADGNKIPVTSMTLNFSVSGVGGAAAAETASPATGNAPVALIGGVAMLALVGAVVSRKRK